MKHTKLIIPILLAYLLYSCVDEPVKPDSGVYVKADGPGAFILCEGLWKNDNATLSMYSYKHSILVNDYFKQSNPGSRLGDLANDIAINGDTAYISMSTAKTIVVMLISTGESLGRIEFPGEGELRKIVIVNDSVAYVTRLLGHSMAKFNPSTFDIIEGSIPTGPAPEGIAYFNNYLFVANSGFGIYLADEEKAGTISVIDINTGQEIALLDSVPNVVELLMDYKSGLLYAAYFNLPGTKDSIGGIVEYDAASLVELRRWYCKSRSIILDTENRKLFFISGQYVSYISLEENHLEISNLVYNSSTDESWYSIGLSPFLDELWIGNARNYSAEGELIVYQLSDLEAHIRKSKTGIIPAKIVFFE